MIGGLIFWAELFGFYLLCARHVGAAAWLAAVPAAVAAALLGAALRRFPPFPRRRSRRPVGTMPGGRATR